MFSFCDNNDLLKTRFNVVYHMSLLFCLLLTLWVQEWEGKPTDQEKEGANGELKAQVQSEVTSDLIEKPIPNAQTAEDLQLSENISIEKSGDAPKDVKPVVSENRTAANEVANGC